jgi:hypothetical protein
MDYNDCIILTHKDKYRFVVPRSAIIGPIEILEQDYSTNTIKPKTIIIMSYDVYKKLAFASIDKYVQVQPDNTVGIAVAEEFSLVIEMLKNSPAFQVLKG